MGNPVYCCHHIISLGHSQIVPPIVVLCEGTLWRGTAIGCARDQPSLPLLHHTPEADSQTILSQCALESKYTIANILCVLFVWIKKTLINSFSGIFENGFQVFCAHQQPILTCTVLPCTVMQCLYYLYQLLGITTRSLVLGKHM